MRGVHARVEILALVELRVEHPVLLRKITEEISVDLSIQFDDDGSDCAESIFVFPFDRLNPPLLARCGVSVALPG